MAYLLLGICVVTAAIQSPLKKLYQNKSSKGIYLFGAMYALVAALFFGALSLFDGGFSFEVGVLPYSLGFAACYTLCSVSGIIALGSGSLALTSLFSSYSLILPTLYGLFRWRNPVFLTQVVGLVFLLVSLYMTNMGKKSADPVAQTQKKQISFKWLIFVILMALSNGGCSILQQEQQYRFAGAYKNEFMFVALLAVVGVLLIMAVLYDRKDAKTTLRLGALPAVLTGVANGVTNLLVLVVANVMVPAFVFFPVISAGGILISYVLSITFFKEKFNAMQKIGILLGLFALVFLNLSLVRLTG